MNVNKMASRPPGGAITRNGANEPQCFLRLDFVDDECEYDGGQSGVWGGAVARIGVNDPQGGRGGDNGEDPVTAETSRSSAIAQPHNHTTTNKQME